MADDGGGCGKATHASPLLIIFQKTYSTKIKETPKKEQFLPLRGYKTGNYVVVPPIFLAHFVAIKTGNYVVIPPIFLVHFVAIKLNPNNPFNTGPPKTQSK